MFNFLTLEEDVFGLDLNDLSLKIIKLKKRAMGFKIQSYNEKKIEPGIIEDGVIKNEEALAKIIKSAYETVKGKKLKTKYAVVSLPEEKSFLQVIQMPKMSDEELKLAVPLEAENYIPMPIEEVYLDFQVIDPIKNYFSNIEVLIVATPKAIVDSYLSCFKKVGLVPLVFEVESQAIARALVKKEVNSSLLILLDFGEDETDFIIFSGHSVRFTSSIPVSSQSLTKAISESLGIGFNEAEKLKIEYGLVENKKTKSHSDKKDNGEKVSQAMIPVLENLISQIKKYINFYRDHSSYEYLLPDGKSEKILISGGGSELKGLAEFMSKKLGIPVELADPLVNLSLKKQKTIIDKDMLSYTTAIGLALRRLDK